MGTGRGVAGTDGMDGPGDADAKDTASRAASRLPTSSNNRSGAREPISPGSSFPSHLLKVSIPQQLTIERPTPWEDRKGARASRHEMGDIA